MVDIASLLLATMLSGVCLATTMVAIWFSVRSARFMLTMAIGIALLVLHVVAFSQYATDPNPWLLQLLLALLALGFYVIYCSANQYLKLERHKKALMPVVAAMLVTAAVSYAGFDGLGFILAYLTAAALLVLSGLMFWTVGAYNGRILLVVSMLSGVCAASFILCAAVLAWNGQFVLGTAPDNWAERINSIVAVACMTVLGALTLSLHHLREQDHLIAEALTDPLTGLPNRRAFLRSYSDAKFGSDSAIAMLDLDHFKKTNDVFGHAVGDLVLVRFASVIRKHCGRNLEGFRLGGEEFALVLHKTTGERAMDAVSRLATAFGSEVVPTKLGPLRSTVSAGLSLGDRSGVPVEVLLSRADAALYEAKDAGRNCVRLSGINRSDQAASRSDAASLNVSLRISA